MKSKNFAYSILSLFIAHATITQASPPTIVLAKINPVQLLSGPYSYFVPPYSYYYFHNMDKLGFHLDWIHRSGPVYPLKKANRPFAIHYTYQHHHYTLDQYFKRNATLGFLVLKNNHIITEHYFHGANVNSRFLSNSMQKSLTSTLIGIAHEEGKISSLDDSIVKYVPALKGSGYDHVTIKQALQMATGVTATEDGFDPHSTIHQIGAAIVHGKPSLLQVLQALKASSIKPGTVFDYESVNTQALGFVIENATHVPLNEYLQRKIWSHLGADKDAFLFRAPTQANQPAFGCLSATLRDYARFGLLMMHGGTLGGPHVISPNWVKEAASAQASAQPKNGEGYGYQWWVPKGKDHAFEAAGIFGQLVYVNPKKHIVIAQTSAWPKPDPTKRWDESKKVIDAIVAAIH